MPAALLFPSLRLLCILSLACLSPCYAQANQPTLQFPLLTSGLQNLVGIVTSGDGSGRLFLIEQRGTIRVWKEEALESEFVLDIQTRTLSPQDPGGDDEQGLLGLAFPPGFGNIGKRHFYVCYTRWAQDPGSSYETVISRFPLDEEAPDPNNRADATREEVVLVIDQPFSNHNGGHINFGKDGLLYIGLGDGGSGGDPDELAQNPEELLGKMLRIDVEGPPDPGLNYAIPSMNPFTDDNAVRDEIWAQGLRNPWRWSFDRKTGDLWIADVGQGSWEEVNYVPASSEGGENYGWDFYEAETRTSFNNTTAPVFSDTTGPVFFYGRSLGRSVTGGYVYRGSRHPRMHGMYFMGDYVSGRIWSITPDGSGSWSNQLLADTNFSLTCFGEDDTGELYVGTYNGAVYRFQDIQDADYLQITDSGFLPDSNRFYFTWGAQTGERYQVQLSTDLKDWSNVGPQITASQSDHFRLRYEEPPAPNTPEAPRFYQVMVID